jgi:PAS domain S-box-containing protein
MASRRATDEGEHETGGHDDRTTRSVSDDLRAVLDASDEAIMLLTPDGTLLSVNEAAARRLGQPQGALIGRNAREFLAGDVTERRMPIIARALETGEPASFEDERDGRVLLNHVRPILDDDGRVVRLAVFSRDVTLQRRAQEAAERSEQRLRRYLAAGHAGTWEWDLRTNENTWSPELWALYGVTPVAEGPSFELWRASIDPRDRDRVAGDVQSAARQGLAIDTEWRVAGTSPERWLHSHGEPERDEQGRIARYLGIVLDTTARKRGERALAESRAKLATALDSMTDAVWVTDAEGRFVDFNEAFATVHRFRSKAECADTFAAYPEILEVYFADGSLAPVEMWAVPRALRGESGTAVEYGLRRKDTGERWVGSYSFAPIRDEAGAIVGSVVVGRDVTARKEAEAERARLEAQLWQAQKMESVGRLAGGVAHDFNNMLSVIMGHVELALDQLDASHPVRDDMREIAAASRRSAELVRQLLAFARKQTILPRVLDANETVRGTLKMLSRLIGEHVELVFRPAEGAWPIRTDPAQVDQILANLCVNARDSITSAGTITIETRNVVLDEPGALALQGATPGAYLRLSVTDDGCGMDAATREHIFEPFFTTKGPGAGTGLGLATVYGAAKQNGGFVEVHSEVGRGSTIAVYFPRHLGAVEREPASEAVGGPRGRETILLVEDEASILRMTKRILEKQGYRVLAAQTPSAALELARTQTDRLDLLLTDVVMPERNGVELARLVEALHPEVKRLYMSGYTADVLAPHGALAEGIRLLQKPFATTVLTRAVRAALDD